MQIWGVAILTEISFRLGDRFLSFWTDGSIKGFDQTHYIAVYTGLSLGGAVVYCINYPLMSLAALRASKQMFEKAFVGLLRAPLSFHDVQPTGRLISRMSNGKSRGGDLGWHSSYWLILLRDRYRAHRYFPDAAILSPGHRLGGFTRHGRNHHLLLQLAWLLLHSNLCSLLSDVVTFRLIILGETAF